MMSLDVFVTEGNVDIFLLKLHKTLDPIERDKLLRLVATEEAKMGRSREHVENGQIRVTDGRERLERQRILVAGLSLEERSAHPAAFLLETLEKTQNLLQEHLRLLRERLEHAKL
ncbi:MAG: hypothetical protein AB7I59_27200 [Geminicoccaceae bacterium]|uniref:hypothetical protein n=1 Tax=Reyranella sp. TaxID=1929291 RepID=UPI003D10F4E5